MGRGFSRDMSHLFSSRVVAPEALGWVFNKPLEVARETRNGSQVALPFELPARACGSMLLVCSGKQRELLRF